MNELHEKFTFSSVNIYLEIINVFWYLCLMFKFIKLSLVISEPWFLLLRSWFLCKSTHPWSESLDCLWSGRVNGNTFDIGIMAVSICLMYPRRLQFRDFLEHKPLQSNHNHVFPFSRWTTRWLLRGAPRCRWPVPPFLVTEARFSLSKTM